jgi:tetratricopeptide (TPR) repeat protein
MERLESEPHTRLRYFCSPQHNDSALYPIIGQMERAARFTHDDTQPSKLDKLDAVLAQTSTSIQDASLFADMLSLSNDGRYPALDLMPEQRRQRTLEALGSQVETLSRSTPVLMIFEDAHWTDPTSLEALSRVVDRLRSLRVLLIVTFRPEFEPPWIGRPYVTPLTINRLAERDIEAMIDRVVGNKLVSASVRQDIVERTDGIPLFVEEMTKAVLEAGSAGAAKRTVASIPPPAPAVPASLQASLMARLDRLGSAREVAQIGAAIGREFSHDLLAAEAGKTDAELGSALDRLVAAGLLFRQGVRPHASYLFKHALVQDAAYGTLLREPRRAMHARIAEMLESQFTEIAENQPELLARHCTVAGLLEKAATLWGKAGQRSLARSALIEAEEQFRRALAQIASLPTTPALRREEIKLYAALRHALVHIKGYAAPETNAAMERARLLFEQGEQLGEPSDDPQQLFSLLNALWSANVVAFKVDEASKLADEFLARANKQDALGPIMNGHRLVGTTLLARGNIAEGRTHLDRGVTLCNVIDRDPQSMHLSADVRPVILGFRSVALWSLGFPEAALLDADCALREARKNAQAGTLMHVLSWTSVVFIFCGVYSVADSRIDELITLANEKSAAQWKALGMLARGMCMVARQPLEAMLLLSPNISAYRSTGSSFVLPSYLSCLAMAYAQLGQFKDAHRAICEALDQIESSGERWYESEVNRLAGEIALKLAESKSTEPRAAAAESYFKRALTVARDQQAKSWELRAAMSMACLWRDLGKQDEAGDLLAPVYSWFSEGFETLDVREANVLLNALRP